MSLSSDQLKVAVCLLGLSFLPANCAAASNQRNGAYTATAYSQTGITASGQYTHRHVVAADPDILPIGSRIRIRNAGKYSGEYVVADTGGKIQGRRLDIYMPNTRECIKFGARHVRVRVIELGSGTRASAKEADRKVNVEVAKALQKGAVGGAATQVDWQQKGTAVNAIAAQAAASSSNAEQVEEARNRPPSREDR